MFGIGSSSKSDNAGNDVDSSFNKPEWQILEKVATASVVEQRKARRWGIFFKFLTFAYLLMIIGALMPSDASLPSVGGEHVALVSLDGIIAADAPANANTVVAGLRNAFAAEGSKAVILAINSPGGSPVQSGYINDEITRLRGKYPEKKLHAVIADLGASGGYYIAAAADNIYADKASLVGSIGVRVFYIYFVYCCVTNVFYGILVRCITASNSSKLLCINYLLWICYMFYIL